MSKDFTAASFTAIRNDINAALAVVGEKHGIQMSIDRITYTKTTFRTTLSAVQKGVAPLPDKTESAQEIKWKAAFMRDPSRYGMTATDYGKKVSLKGATYIIIGARPKANADIVVKNVIHGNHVAFNASQVRDALRTTV